VRKADNLPPSCAVVTKFGNLNFLKPFGPLRVCNGTALPLPLPLLTKCNRNTNEDDGYGRICANVVSLSVSER